MADYFKSGSFGLSFGEQTTYTTEQTSMSDDLDCTLPSFTFAREVTDFALSRSKDFEEGQKVVGSRHGGSFSFSAPVTSQASGFNPATTAAALNPVMKLIKDFMGSSFVEATGDTIGATASDANTWELTAGGLSNGCGSAVVGPTTPYTVKAQGFIKDDDGAQEVTLFEDAQGTPAQNDVVVAMQTLYGSAAVAQPTPKTFKVVGDHTDHCMVLIGCMPQSMTLTLEAGKPITADFTYHFTDYKIKDPSTNPGGVTAPTSYTRVGAPMGVNQGRLWINSTSDGTSDTTDISVGIGGASLSVECALQEVASHGASQGVADVICLRRSARFSCTIPYTSAWVDGTAEDSTFSKYLEDGTSFSVSLQTGKQAGQLFQMLIPAAIVVEQPGLSDNDGIQSFDVTFGVGAYSSDGSASGDVKNSPIRIAIG